MSHTLLRKLSNNIYSSQIFNSKKRKHIPPIYTQGELYQWILLNPSTFKLYSDWVLSDFDRNLTPSIDRLNDYVPYRFDNIQLTTWEFNDNKHKSDRKSGINNKINVGVIQHKNDLLVNSFHSTMEAERCTGINHSNISKCLHGKLQSTGGFTWSYL